jgi:uncharacterized protein (TIGR03545 family)
VRWSYLAPRLAVLAVLWTFFYFFFDPLLGRGIEKLGSKALGARVELKGFHTGFYPPSIDLKGFAAADPEDPMKNLVEARGALFALEGRPLLEKKAVVRQAEVLGLAFGTPRARSGVFKGGPPTKAEKTLSKWTADAKEAGSGFGANAKADLGKEYKVDPEELSSVKLAREFEARWPGRFEEWKRKIDAFDAEGRVKAISSSAEGLGGSGDILGKAARLKGLKDKADELKKGLSELRRGVTADLEQAKADVKAVEAAKNEDIEQARKRLHLPRFDAERLSAYLLGPRSAAKLGKALRLIEVARRKMPVKGAPPGKEAPRGQDIEFPRGHAWPSFWLKAARLTGTADLGGPVEFLGEASDFSTSPALVPEPARLSLAGGAGGRSFKLSLELDHRRETPRDRIEFRVSGLPVAEFAAGDSGSFQVLVSPGAASLSGKVELEGDALRGKVSFSERGVKLTARTEGLQKDMARLLEAALAGVSSVEAEADLSGTLQEPRLNVSSNLGKAVSEGVSKALGKEVEARTKALRDQVDKITKEHTDKLSKMLGEGAQGPLGKLGAGDAGVQGLQGLLEKKLGVPGLPDLKRLFR